MKAFIAYTLLVAGIPVFTGLAMGAALTMPIAWLLRRKTRLRLPNLLYLEIINGFVASVAGAFLFRLFGLTPGLIVPFIMAAWITLYFFSYHQPLSAWVSWLGGIFVGWFTLAKVILTA
jgi:hypothetical protein